MFWSVQKINDLSTLDIYIFSICVELDYLDAGGAIVFVASPLI